MRTPSRWAEPSLEHAGERGLARASARHGEDKAVTDVVSDLVGQIEDEGERIGGGLEPVRVAGAQHRQAGEVVVARPFGGESQDIERGSATATVDRLQVGAEDAAVVQGDALLAVEQLAGAALERADVAGEQMLDDGGDDALDEHRRDRDRAAAQQARGSRPRACRPRTAHREPRGRSSSSLAHRHRRTAASAAAGTSRRGRSTRLAVQPKLVGARLVDQRQLGQVEQRAQERIGRSEPAGRLGRGCARVGSCIAIDYSMRRRALDQRFPASLNSSR